MRSAQHGDKLLGVRVVDAQLGVVGCRLTHNAPGRMGPRVDISSESCWNGREDMGGSNEIKVMNNVPGTWRGCRGVLRMEAEVGNLR
jgi:hypothetical protein